MTPLRFSTVALVAGILLLWVLTFRMTSTTAAEWPRGQEGKKSTREIIPSDVSVRIRKVLEDTTEPARAAFDATRASPFRLPGARDESAVARPAPPRKMFRLKGFLLKDRPLAILESDEGTTHICGVGDVAEGQKVVRIEKDRVTISSPGGAYVLSVKEE